ncbi:hypothetical protein [Saccharothrix hoggarensis]|uniref:Beta-lactamase n=1 Tax=Saccharothrix hoggarensis TaxID=913853 RepID=A0ABW3QQY2_9PSEU
MKAHLIGVVVALAALTPPLPAAAHAEPTAAELTAAEPTAEAIDAYLTEALRDTGLPGLSVVTEDRPPGRG